MPVTVSECSYSIWLNKLRDNGGVNDCAMTRLFETELQAREFYGSVGGAELIELSTGQWAVTWGENNNQQKGELGV
jgi:hypothetical protein